MEGITDEAYRVQYAVIKLLTDTYSCTTDALDWKQRDSSTPMFVAKRFATIGCQSQTSSGYSEKAFNPEEFFVPANATASLKENALNFFFGLVDFVHEGREIAHEVQSSVHGLGKKFIDVSYGKATANINIGGCIAWGQIFKVIKNVKYLNIGDKEIIGLYKKVDGVDSFQTEWYGLSSGMHYSVGVKEDHAPVFTHFINLILTGCD